MLALIEKALAPSREAQAEAIEGHAAAVAAIFRESHGTTEILLIERALREGDPWSGHMALPGGRRSPSDAELLATATRETLEEIGLDLHKSGRLLGALPSEDATGRGSAAQLLIKPFVFELTEHAELTLNDEVKEALWTPIEPLLRGERRTTVRIAYQGQDWDLPGWTVEGRTVWGLTYRMLSTVFRLLPSG